MQCGTALYALLWRRVTKETTAFLLCILVVILQHGYFQVSHKCFVHVLKILSSSLG